MLQVMAVLSGCDYLASLPQIGIISAHQLVARHKSADRVLTALCTDPTRRGAIPPEYKVKFMRALLTFRHQSVYAPDEKKMVPLHPLPAHVARALGCSFLGPLLSADLAQQIAGAIIHPVTHRPWDTLPKRVTLPKRCVWPLNVCWSEE